MFDTILIQTSILKKHFDILQLIMGKVLKFGKKKLTYGN
ncbi:hypothetical protein PEDI_55040 [Persicobacter diffluens]|uniref:Uncharacterized protein n=1 Tax=Persicobacter diffluens TaxID=981 RepID=A0AAN4W5Z4_9BACT|nr:hypothetical protein PEDI_55040 [Persicobacter diffluens]